MVHAEKNPMRESQIEKKICAVVKEKKGETIKLLSPKGIPDRLILVPQGKMIFAEIKTPSGNLSPLQSYWLQHLTEMGFEAHCLRSEKELKKMLEGKKEQKKNIVVVYSARNSKGRNDASGAFVPQAKAFAAYHKVPLENVLGIDCINTRAATRAAKLLEHIVKAGNENKIDAIALFCHGWAKGIQFGLSLNNLAEFVAAIKPNAAQDLKVVLYACLTANAALTPKIKNKIGVATDGGFADRLRDCMSAQGLVDGWVDAHKTAGHTTMNPYVVRFDCHYANEPGGAWLVAPRSALWRPWIDGQRQSEKIRLGFPLMTELELKITLAQGYNVR
jgi:hypothetical protein